MEKSDKRFQHRHGHEKKRARPSGGQPGKKHSEHSQGHQEQAEGGHQHEVRGEAYETDLVKSLDENGKKPDLHGEGGENHLEGSSNP